MNKIEHIQCYFTDTEDQNSIVQKDFYGPTALDELCRFLVSIGIVSRITVSKDYDCTQEVVD